MKIIQQPDMGTLTEQELREISDFDRDWAGRRDHGFCEYAICTNPECRRMLSIEDVHGQNAESVPLDVLEKNYHGELRCPACETKAEFLLHPDLFPRYLQVMFSQQVYGALYKYDGKIKGYSTAFMAPLRDGVESNVNYRYTFDVNKIIEDIARRVGMMVAETAVMPAVFFNRIALSPELRGQGVFPAISQAALDLHPEYDEYPLISETRANGRLLPLLYATGAQEIQMDRFGGVTVWHPSTGDFRRTVSLSPEEFKKQFADSLAEGRKKRADYIQKHSPETDIRHLPGIPLVPERLINFGVPVNDVPDSSSFETEKGKKIRIENYTSKEISKKVLREVSNFFRYIFANTFEQYLVYPSEGKAISATQVFGTDKKYVPLEELDNFDLDSYPRHPVTGEKAVFWHDPQTTLERFKEKSRGNAHFTVFRDIETDRLLGLTFGYQTTVQGLFESEEWADPLHYSSVRSPNQRDFNIFLTKINEERIKRGLEPFNPESVIYGWNCITTDPGVRGPKTLGRLTSAFFKNIQPSLREKLTAIGEGQFGTKAHSLFIASGAHEVRGVLTEKDPLEPGDPVIVSSTLAGLTNFYCNP